jgi:hypothetical protein
MENTEPQKTVTKQAEPNTNRGMSKKERRRVEALKQRLEPRIEKLETQVNEHLEKINSLSDKREVERDGELATGKPPVAVENGKQETRSPQQETQEKDDAPLALPSNEAAMAAESQAGESITDQTAEKQESPIGKLVNALQVAGLGSDPTALRLVADLAALNPSNRTKPRASHLIQPSGGGVPPAPDLRTEYEKQVMTLRPGDVDGLMEVKREFRRRGLDIY